MSIHTTEYSAVQVVSPKRSLRVAVVQELDTSTQGFGSSLVFSSAMIHLSILSGDCLVTWDSTLLPSRMCLRLGALSATYYTRQHIHAMLMLLAVGVVNSLKFAIELFNSSSQLYYITEVDVRPLLCRKYHSASFVDVEREIVQN